MIDVQDVHGFSLDRVHNYVGERRKGELSCAATVTGSAQIGRGFESTDPLVNRPDSRFREVRVVPLEVILDAL